ncbi:MerR family transcriptional regulator [Micromonospora gifhornensis]|uniref:MerR family transcriptional regulator n=1 Tax=Micromonospora TaxID=1873 RepID=UPI000F88CD1D|nr:MULTISPECIES: MerR family transcriptional regulator [Micromonospora]RUL92267.1 MerR family DNA-binding transcriptional regulator [Verrucosispora sp. FIM060022]WSK40304.1 MerR family transcriptional regulator [Micromonospora maris]
MRIGELSARTGASERMLRYYEEQGLLKPERTASGYRVYAEADVDRVARIRCMLSASLPSGVVGQALRFLLDGRAAIPDEPADRARLAETLESELDQLTEKIASLQHSRELLATFVADVRGDAVGPGRPGDPGARVVRRSVSKAGPATGRAR